MKTVGLIILFAFNCLNSFGQIEKFNNWLDVNKVYLKFNIEKDGIYKITHTDLQQAGLKNFKNLTVFHHGIPLKVKYENVVNGELMVNGALIFYAQKNKGELDSLLYETPAQRMNPYQSLYSDAASYFITNADENQVSMATVNSITSNENPIFNEKLTFSPNSQYSFNNNIGLLPDLMQSYYEAGEGWTGKFVSGDSVTTYNFNLPEITSSNEVKLNIKLNGRSKVFHNYDLFINDKLTDSLFFEPFGPISRSYELKTDAGSNLKITLKNKVKQEYDWISLTFFDLFYTRKLSNSLIDRPLNIFGKHVFYIPDSKHTAIDISDFNKQKWIESSGSYGYQTIQNNDTKEVYVSSKFEKPSNFQLFTPKNLLQKFDYLIITDPVLKASAEAFAAYRSSTAGGSFTTNIVYTKDLYDHFFYGEKSPVALKNYILSLQKSQKLKYILLLGRAISFPDLLKTSTELVPTWGYPASDFLLSAVDNIPTVATGRLSVNTDAEVFGYLEKVKEHESTLAGTWRKKILHLSGGQSEFELNLLSDLLKNLSPKLETEQLGPLLSSKKKQTDALVEETDISAEINKGVGMLTFAGHGSSASLDFNIGFCTDPKRNINNKGKYPLMFFNGCGVGNVFYRYNALSADWLLAPNKGALAVLANSYWSYYYPTDVYLNELYSNLLEKDEYKGLSIGEIQLKTVHNLSKYAKDSYLLAEMHQVVLQGDPAVKIFNFEKPEYQVAEKSIFLLSNNLSKSISKSDSLKIGFIAENIGKYEKNKSLEYNVKITYADNKILIKNFKINAFVLTDTLQVSFVNSNAISKIEVNLDPQNSIQEYSETNNSQELNIGNEWGKISTLGIYPEFIFADNISPILDVKFDNKNIKNGATLAQNSFLNIKLEDERSLDFKNKKGINIFLKKCEACVFEVLDISNFKINQSAINKIDLSSQLKLAPGNYTILIQGQDNANNSVGIPYQRNFKVLETIGVSFLKIQPNPSQEFIGINLNINELNNPKNGTFFITDVQGKIIAESNLELSVGENIYNFPIDDKLKSGTYLIKIQVNTSENKILNFVEKTIVIR